MIKNDLGFVLPTLENNPSHINLCELISLLIDRNKKYQFCIFNQYSSLVDTRSVPLMPMSHAKYFIGDLVVLDFPSLVLSINFPTIKNIYYFTNNIPWSTSYYEYKDWKHIFQKNNLKIFSASEDITKIYSMMWNIKTKTIKEINYDTIISIL